MVKEITCEALQNWLDEGRSIQLIDVRAARERIAGHLPNDIHIPVGDIISQSEQIAENQAVVLYCRSGIRSYEAALVLEEELGFENLYNLKRGILAWKGAFVRD